MKRNVSSVGLKTSKQWNTKQNKMAEDKGKMCRDTITQSPSTSRRGGCCRCRRRSMAMESHRDFLYLVLSGILIKAPRQSPFNMKHASFSRLGIETRQI